RRQWTRAFLILTNGISDATIIADMQETDYETLDIPDTKLTVPLKQFRVCHKKVFPEGGDASKNPAGKQLRCAKLIQTPLFQIHLSSRVLFAKKHMWIGFTNRCEQELWYTTLHTLITRRTQHMQCLKSSESGSSLRWDISQPSELDFLASALPCMLDNEIYESTSVIDTYEVSVIQTEKARELGISGRYLLKITPMAFELLDPLYHATIQVWPLRYVRKFGVHMKRLYLICGSGCHQGKGLFIFLVQDATVIQNRLLLLAHQPLSSSVLSRRLTHSHITTTPLLPHEVTISEATKSEGYWFEAESPISQTLRTPMSPSSLNPLVAEQGPNSSRSAHGYALSSPRQTQSSVTFENGLNYSNQTRASCERKQPSGKWFTDGCSQTPADSNSVDEETPGEENEELKRERQTPNPSSRSFLTHGHAQVHEFKHFGNQPVYANTENFPSPVPLNNTVSRSEQMNEGRREDKVEDHRPQIKVNSVKRSWRPIYLFEPIDEKEERVSRSESESTIKAHEDDHPVVTSSTPGEEILEEELFGSESGLSEGNEKRGKREKSVPRENRTRRAITRSATWDGWLFGRPLDLQASEHKVADATVQTEDEDDSLHSGSDIVIRTAF
ncbi:docking protein 3, partial [Clonorchis sinensis]